MTSKSVTRKFTHPALLAPNVYPSSVTVAPFNSLNLNESSGNETEIPLTPSDNPSKRIFVNFPSILTVPPATET